MWTSYFIDLYRISQYSILQYRYWYIDISIWSACIIQITTYIVVWNVNEILIKWDAGQYNPILFFRPISGRYLKPDTDTWCRYRIGTPPNENDVFPLLENKLCERLIQARKAHTPQNHNLKVATMKSKANVRTLLFALRSKSMLQICTWRSNDTRPCICHTIFLQTLLLSLLHNEVS